MFCTECGKKAMVCPGCKKCLDCHPHSEHPLLSVLMKMSAAFSEAESEEDFLKLMQEVAGEDELHGVTVEFVIGYRTHEDWELRVDELLEKDETEHSPPPEWWTLD